jgi:hypothetical protein
MIKYDTYHDTWTNYLMEQESSPIQVQTEGDGATAADRTTLMKKKKDGPSKAILRSILLSVLHV